MCRRRRAARIKRILGLCTPRGHGDVQHVIDDRAAFLDLARNSDWIGGHVPRDKLGERPLWLDRPIEYFSCVREPVAQLVSHLNYSFERYNRSNYYELHNLEEQRLDAELMSDGFFQSCRRHGPSFAAC